MVENSWNFQFLPPQVDTYSSSEVYSSIIHSAKAFTACGPVAKHLVQCRQKPLGKIIDPETCQPHAETLIECYNEVQSVPAACRISYEKAFSCLQSKGRCEESLKEYIKCNHPAASKYEKY